jgi:hypothetical protein
MNAPRDTDQIIHAWLEEGPTVLPAPTARAIEVATRTAVQSGAQRMPWRRTPRPSGSVLGAAAAVVAVLLIGALLLGPRDQGVIGDPESSSPTPSTSPSPAATPTPTSTNATPTGAPSVALSPPPAEPLPPIEGAPDVEFVEIDELEISDDGQRIVIAFTGSPPFDPNDPCTGGYSAWSAVGTVLDVGVWQSRSHPPAECDSMGHGRTIEVTLDRPFSGEVWRDVSGPFVHLLAPPRGLLTIDVPAGWQLVEEGDVDLSETRGWTRDYTPPDGEWYERLTFMQSIGGSFGPGGGPAPREESGTVTINGELATYTRYARTHSIALTWRSGDSELLLATDERVISLEELIEIAESARWVPPAS